MDDTRVHRVEEEWVFGDPSLKGDLEDVSGDAYLLFYTCR